MLKYENSKVPGREDKDIVLTDNSPKMMLYDWKGSVSNNTQDVKVVVTYEKVNAFTFRADQWMETIYAKARFEVTNSSHGFPQTPDRDNSRKNFSGHSFTWYIDSIKDDKDNTWEMDQLEINGEPIEVPMLSLSSKEEKTVTTRLSTGTEVTLKVKSAGYDERRHYTLQFDNCYEDVTISGGNLVESRHREFVIHKLSGVKEGQHFSKRPEDANVNWWELRQDSLIERKDNYNTPAYFRVKVQKGYANVQVSLLTKEGKLMQKNDELSVDFPLNNDGKKYVEYRNSTGKYTDPSSGIEIVLTEPVKYEDWKADAEEYYYFSGTKSLDEYMEASGKPDQGVVLFDIFADPKMGAIDYQNGSGNGESGPQNEHIINMPLYQDGGTGGYNVVNNFTIPVSNKVPVDRDERFLFSHWEILTVDPDTNQFDGHVKRDQDGKPLQYKPGQSVDVSSEMVEEFDDCLRFDEAKKRDVVTFRAVWEKRERKDPMPYMVRYILADKKEGELVNQRRIRTCQHTAPWGSLLLSDLWKWENGKKEISETIQRFIKGDNDFGEDFSKEGVWVIDEERSTLRVADLNETNNILTIYLVKQSSGISVSKLVSGEGGDKNKAFHFTLTLKAADDKAADINGRYGDMTFQNGEAMFTLKHGETRLAADIPVGLTYEVTETEAGKDDYTTTASHEKGVVSEEPVQVVFKNRKGSPSQATGTGDLSIAKYVSGRGAAADKDREFHFTVTVDTVDKSMVNGVYGDLSFTDGECSFTLKDRQVKLAEGLPAGSTYQVVEKESVGYTVTKSGDTGTIKEDEIASAMFNNHKESSGDGGGYPGPVIPGSPGYAGPGGSSHSATRLTASPRTGDESRPLLWIALLGLAAAGLFMGLSAYRRKERGKPKA